MIVPKIRRCPIDQASPGMSFAIAIRWCFCALPVAYTAMIRRPRASTPTGAHALAQSDLRRSADLPRLVHRRCRAAPRRRAGADRPQRAGGRRRAGRRPRARSPRGAGRHRHPGRAASPSPGAGSIPAPAHRWRLRLRQHGLTAVAAVPVPPGAMRVAAAADVPWIIGAQLAFRAEAGMSERPSDVAAVVPGRVEGGEIRVWEDGDVVAYAGYFAVATANARIAPVYTAPDARGRGYATALVAALARELLARGHRALFLTADAANPTANALYAGSASRSCPSRSTSISSPAPTRRRTDPRSRCRLPDSTLHWRSDPRRSDGTCRCPTRWRTTRFVCCGSPRGSRWCCSTARGGEWATLEHIDRRGATVRIERFDSVERGVGAVDHAAASGHRQRHDGLRGAQGDGAWRDRGAAGADGAQCAASRRRAGRAAAAALGSRWRSPVLRAMRTQSRARGYGGGAALARSSPAARAAD